MPCGVRCRAGKCEEKGTLPAFFHIPSRVLAVFLKGERGRKGERTPSLRRHMHMGGREGKKEELDQESTLLEAHNPTDPTFLSSSHSFPLLLPVLASSSPPFSPLFFRSLFLIMAPSADWADRTHPDTLVLFDVDGTLSPSRRTATKEMLELLQTLRKRVVIGYVGGSDFSKQVEQLGPNLLKDFDFCFSENGLTAYRLGKELASQSFISHLGEKKYQELVNFSLRYIADLDIPVKR